MLKLGKRGTRASGRALLIAFVQFSIFRKKIEGLQGSCGRNSWLEREPLAVGSYAAES